MPVFRRETSMSVDAGDFSAASNGSSGWLAMFFVLGGLVVAGVVAAKKWFYPYRIEDLEGQVRSIEALIKENSSLNWNMLGDSARRFRDKLERLDDQVRRIRTNMYTEPDKAKIVAWIRFQWSQLSEIKACYLTLQKLQWNLTIEIEERTRSLHTGNDRLPGPLGPRIN
ncbi:hypothetical protein L218DRAFT_1054881 [Marasmius fiardii PR-910]|nr:hypothetical protein L218DRAFT_1054881 [Marasmius fiardii PR-910]